MTLKEAKIKKAKKVALNSIKKLLNLPTTNTDPIIVDDTAYCYCGETVYIRQVDAIMSASRERKLITICQNCRSKFRISFKRFAKLDKIQLVKKWP